MITTENINKIAITAREYEIMNCASRIDSVKKIAEILNISPLIVQARIREIFNKFSFKSKEDLIEYVDNEDEFLMAKAHYTNLLIFHHLRQRLTQVAPFVEEDDLSCVIDENDKNELADVIGYLQMAKVKVILRDANTVIDNQQEIKVLTKEYLDEMSIEPELKKIIFVCKNQVLAPASVLFVGFKIYDCSSLRELPSSIFRILSVLGPKLNFTKYIGEFHNLENKFTALDSFYRDDQEDDDYEIVALSGQSTLRKYAILSLFGLMLIIAVVQLRYLLLMGNQ
jgi:DNA-binding CsgD family transcriptional regulator